jgi:hypothetical protein
MQERLSPLHAAPIASESTRLLSVIQLVARDVKFAKAAGGVLLVRCAAAAAVMANRCPPLRAIVGTCLESVDQGIAEVAANVLIIEHPTKTLQQVNNMLARFLKVRSEISPAMSEKLALLANG